MISRSEIEAPIGIDAHRARLQGANNAPGITQVLDIKPISIGWAEDLAQSKF